MRIKTVFTYLIFLLISCSNTEEGSPHEEFLGDSTIVYKSIQNVDENLTSLDIYTVPKSKKLRPVVFWIHGGAWAVGDKAGSMKTKISFFKSLGYVMVSVNYRLSPFPAKPNDESRIKHPDHITDVADALQWVYQNIHLYGGDKTNIAIFGHSAGAHLAALMGTNQSLLSNRNIDPNHIKGIGVIDTQAFDIEKVIKSISTNKLYINAFGKVLKDQQDASPYFQIDNSAIIPTYWLFPERGSQERKNFLHKFIEKLEIRNKEVTVMDANAYSHLEVNNLIGDSSNTIMTNAVTSFLNTCFSNE